MSEAKRPLTQRLADLYMGLVITGGTLCAAYLVLVEAGLLGVLSALAEGGPALAGEMARGTLLGNPTLYVLLVLGAIAELTYIPLPRGARMTAGFLVAFAALLMLGLPGAVLVVGFAALAAVVVTRGSSWQSAWFNVGQYTLAYGAAQYALTYRHVYIPGFPSRDDYAYVGLATLAFLVVNFAIVDGYLALRKRIPLWRIVWEDDRTEILVTLVLSPMSFMMAAMYAAQGWGGMVLVWIPLIATAFFVRLFLRVKQAGVELAAYNEQLTILQEVARRISSQMDLDQTLGLISHEIRRVVPNHDCMIFLLDEKTGMLERQTGTGTALSPLSLPVAHGVFGQVVRERAGLLKPNLAEEALDVGALGGYKSLLAVPIQNETEVLGVLALLHREADAFGAPDERLLNILASQAAVAIRNAQLYRATQQLAVTDGLTKLYNRRYFEEQLAAELDRARRHDHPVSLVMLDVDHFKKLNDTHGHLLGDQVLQGVARVIANSTRDTDLVARYGGEEFVVILPETGPDGALHVAERIRRNVKAHPFWGRQQTPLTVTISVGVASDPSATLPAEELKDTADKSLYQAKAQGRDRVCRTIYHADSPLEFTESREEVAPEAPMRRPTRGVSRLNTTEWRRYLLGHLDDLFADWVEDPPVAAVLGDAREFWRVTAAHFVRTLLKKIDSTEEERNTWLETFQRAPLYRPVQSELARLIQDGVTLTQMEHAILGFYKRMTAMVQGAPFPLEERMAVGGLQERLFHVLQLMVSQVWHDFYQATSEHLYLVAELESRLGADFEPGAVLEEIARLTARALAADACIVLSPDTAGVELCVTAAYGLTPPAETAGVPLAAGIMGASYHSREVMVIPDLETDARLYRPFYEGLRAARPVRAALMVPLVHDRGALGVLLCLSEQRDHFSPLDARLGRDIGARLAVALERQQREAERQTRFLAAIGALSDALSNRKEGEDRRDTVISYATAIAEAMAVPPAQIETLKQATKLHDIGELAVPESILSKPAALTAEEQAVVRAHPLTGAEILGYVDALTEVVPVVRHHHERMDGTGYPDGLKGDEIPLLARILAVADAYTAMTAARPYRAAMTATQALYELRRSHHFDPAVIDRLERVVEPPRDQ